MAVYGEVLEVQRLTPRMIRVVLGGAGLSGFESTGWADEYINAQFIPDGAPYEVPFDVEAARALPADQRPKGRRLTVRRWEPAGPRLTIDVVVHGDEGHAGRWANHAQPGDRLQFLGPSGAYTPDPEADAHLLLGDESALPAIASALEHVPPGRHVQVVALVDDADHHVDLESPGRLEVTWLHRCDVEPGSRDQILDALQALELPHGGLHVFVHGEANEVRAARRHLLGERGIPKDGNSISPYWRRNLTDEEWRQVKKDWLSTWDQDLPGEAPGT